MKRYVARLARRSLKTITSFQTTQPVVALTFDDGPHPVFTPRLLDLLDQHDARATFFMVGRSAQAMPELVKQVARRGHAIANHTFDHVSFASISGRQRRQQIRMCARAIAPYGSRLFRPPWGHQTLASRIDIRLLRHDVICWSVDVGDWWQTDSQLMAQQLEAQAQPGSIILLHDAIDTPPGSAPKPDELTDRQPMLDALAIFLERTRGRLRCVTVPQMFDHGRPVRTHWYHQS